MKFRLLSLLLIILAGAVLASAQSVTLSVIRSKQFSDPEKGINRLVQAIRVHGCTPCNFHYSECLKRANDPILDEIRTRLGAFARERGVDILIDLDSGIIIEEGPIDFTEEFIREFNRITPAPQSNTRLKRTRLSVS